ncbi:FHA domain-containing protein [Kribbella sp. NPDC026611]|uniref:FHA domain-containing protein n=1 Tax=Kribbella sp. NPDC026611 TaxID=3154911 RepID=UPI0033F56A21
MAVVAIGRDSSDARIADGLASYDGVSRQHAELTVADTGVVLADVGSVNGTVVDGRPAGNRPVPLDPGLHEVRLGRAAVLTIDVIAGEES